MGETDKISIIGREGCSFSLKAEALVKNLKNARITYTVVENESEAKREIKEKLKVGDETTFPIVNLYWRGKEGEHKTYLVGGFDKFKEICDEICDENRGEKQTMDKLTRKIKEKIFAK